RARALVATHPDPRRRRHPGGAPRGHGPHRRAVVAHHAGAGRLRPRLRVDVPLLPRRAGVRRAHGGPSGRGGERAVTGPPAEGRRRRRDLLLSLVVPALVCLVAVVHTVRVDSSDLSTWSGAGFGMFATIDG